MSGGGGASSGAVDYPEYMKNSHESMLGKVSAGLVNTTSSNPYTSYSAPSTTILDSETPITELLDYINSRITSIQNLTNPAVVPDETIILAHLPVLASRDAQLQALDDLEGVVDLVTDVYPRYEAGMRDINAVQSSSFTIGRAVLEATYQGKMQAIKQELINANENMRTDAIKNRSQFQTGIDMANATFLQQLQTMKQQLLAQMDPLRDAIASKLIEHRRIRLVAAFEKTSMDIDIDSKGGRWPWDSFQYAANVLAGIGGGTALTDQKANRWTSALGGGMSGAAAGAQAGGGGWGALAGGVLGAGAAMLSS